MMIIVPYKSVGPIKMGMDTDQVRGNLGEPKLVSKGRSGNQILRYEGLNVTVAQCGVVEVELLPDTTALLDGTDIFSDPKAFGKLCTLDGDPQECVGTIILLNLGMSMAGFHDRDESHRSVTVFAKDRWSTLQSRMQKYQINPVQCNEN